MQTEDILLRISSLNRRIPQLSQKFTAEAAKIQHKLNKVQISRPITNRISAFYQVKERKERELMQSKDLLQLTFDHNKAILTTQRLALENAKFHIESQIQLINIQLH